jgi:spore germination protein GerM
VEELVRGPAEEGVRPIPSTTRLLAVFWDGDGELVLNFSDDLRTDHPGGSEAEIATVRCLVRTIAGNFPAVERVRLLVDGEPVATLAGHVDLSRALDVEDYR